MTQVTPSPSRRFPLGRPAWMLLLLSPFVLFGGLLWGYYDVGARIAQWCLPPLVPVVGRVYLHGKPLPKAQVFTQPLRRSCRGAMGIADTEGRFVLRTDVEGDFLEGAYAGEHRVIVWGIDPNAPSGPFKPPLITPTECAEFETTPLRLQVHRDPARNSVELDLDSGTVKQGPGG